MTSAPKSEIRKGQLISIMINSTSKLLSIPKKNVQCVKTAGRKKIKSNLSRNIPNSIEINWTPREAKEEEIKVLKELYRIKGSQV